MKVAILSATEGEVLQLKKQLNSIKYPTHFPAEIQYFITGVGILASSFSIAKILLTSPPDFIIQLGIAGTFDPSIALGEVVAVKSETIGDAGVEEDGTFKDLFDLNLQSLNDAPFNDGFLENPWLSNFNFLNLRSVASVTVNEITTRLGRITLMKEKYHAEIESMEGASLHYAALLTGTPFIQIRAISNAVGERDKASWNFKDSFTNLANATITYMEKLNEHAPKK